MVPSRTTTAGPTMGGTIRTSASGAWRGGAAAARPENRERDPSLEEAGAAEAYLLQVSLSLAARNNNQPM
jgi:hypothetical protein